MPHFSLMTVTMFLPLLGALFLMFVRGDDRIVAMNSRHIAMLISVCTFLLTLLAWGAYSYQSGGVQFIEKYDWMPSIGISWHVGLDALSVVFMLLVSFLSMLSLYVGRKRILTMVREYMILTLIIETFLLIAICSEDFFQFFIFYEGAVIPLFLLIAVWGVEKRAYSSFRFCLYSAFSSILFFAGLAYIYSKTDTADMAALTHLKLSLKEQNILLLGFVISFSFKVPLFPFHIWFTDSHAEAPVPAAILLSGVFSKVPFYAFIRMASPLLPDVLPLWEPYLMGWALFSALYGSLITTVQDDAKKIIGYTHIAQSGILALALFCWTPTAMKGLLFLCLTQSVCLISFVLTSHSLLERVQSRELKTYTGLISVMPYLGAAFFISILAVSTFPLTPAFLGEFLVLTAVFQKSAVLSIAALCASVFLCSTFIRMFSRTMLGETAPEEAKFLPDMTWREKITFSTLGLIMIYLTLLPERIHILVSEAIRPLFPGV